MILFILCSLHHSLACIPSLTDLFGGCIIARTELVKNESIQLHRLYLAVLGNNAFICAYIHDLSDDRINVIRFNYLRQLAFKSNGKLGDYRRIYKSAILSISHTVAHAAFITFTVPFSSYAAIIRTGIGKTAGCTPKFFLILICLRIFSVFSYRR